MGKTAVLPATTLGPEAGVPVILLHGFAADRTTFLPLQVALQNRRRTIAFDLPGHGEALVWPRVGTGGTAAKAVADSLTALGLARVHLVGHSMGAAAAALAALHLAGTDRVASLTLFAPGGFGPEINHRLLRRYALSTAERDIEAALEQMVGADFAVPAALVRKLADDRADERRVAVHAAILETMLDGDGRQKSFDTAALAGLDHPVRVVWGTQDRVLPTRHAHNLPGLVATHVFPGVGHMIPLEIPRETARLVLDATAAP